MCLQSDCTKKGEGFLVFTKSHSQEEIQTFKTNYPIHRICRGNWIQFQAESCSQGIMAFLLP